MFYIMLAETKEITFQRSNETRVFQNVALFFNSAVPLHYPIQLIGFTMNSKSEINTPARI